MAKLSEAELMTADPSTLTNDELARRVNLAALRKAERELELVEAQNAEFADKKEDRRRIAENKTKTTEEENNRLEREKANCAHQTGGKDRAGFFNGDGSIYGSCTAPQVLPTGEVYYICFRCQKEWHKPSKRAVLEGRITLAQYQRLDQEYNQVARWPRKSFDTGNGEFPGSILFRIPALELQKAKDDQEFAAFLAKQNQLGEPVAVNA